MNETMNTGVEVTTGVSGLEGVTHEITIEETSSGPSKGFIALVVGGIAAVAVGATVAIKRHKKKKAAQAEEELFEDDFDEYLEDEEDDQVEIEENQKEEVESKK